MRFPKSVVQVRECGIAFRYILLGHLGGANLGTGFLERGRPCPSFYGCAMRPRECRWGPASQAWIFSRAAQFRKKVCKCRRFSGSPDGTTLKK